MSKLDVVFDNPYSPLLPDPPAPPGPSWGSGGTGTSATMGSVTFTFWDAVTGGSPVSVAYGYDAVGRLCIQSPGSTVYVEWTPGPTTIGGIACGQGQKNPQRGLQGYDARCMLYSAPLAQTGRVGLLADDSLTVQVPNPNKNTEGGGTASHPVYTLEYACCVCLSTLPTSTQYVATVGPFANGGTARPVVTWDDSTLPSVIYALTGSMGTVTDIVTLTNRLLKYNPALGQFDAPELRRQMCVSGFTTSDGYGQKLNVMAEYRAIRYMGNGSYTSKRALARAEMGQHVDSYDAIRLSADKLEGDGATNIGQFMTHALCLGWRGQNAAIGTLRADIGTNELVQPFFVDAALLAKMDAPHSVTATTHPRTTLRKTITAVSGTTLTFANANASNEWYKDPYTNCVLVRESDGATATIVSANMTAKTMTIDAQPGSPFAVNDVVWVRAPYTINIGDIQWSIKGSSNLSYWGPESASYFHLNNPLGPMMCVQAFGFTHSSNTHLRSHCLAAYQTNYPSATNNWDSVHETTACKEFYDAYWATLAGVTQTVG